MTILTIARLTLREASRRKLLLAVVVLTIILAILTGWAFHRLLGLPCGGPRGADQVCSATDLKLVAATVLVMLMFMFSFVLALGAAFLGAPAVASDVENGTLLSMLPRPIRRSDVVIGKWLGLAILIALYSAVACGMEFVIAHIALGYEPPHPVIAVAFLIFEALTVLTLAIAGSTRISAMTWGIIVTVVFGLTWMGGIAGAVGTAFHSTSIENIGTVSSLLLPTDGLWRAAVYNLEPVSIIVAGNGLGRAASGNPFFVSNGPTSAYLAWAVCWVAGVLALGVWNFNRREL